MRARTAVDSPRDVLLSAAEGGRNGFDVEIPQLRMRRPLKMTVFLLGAVMFAWVAARAQSGGQGAVTKPQGVRAERYEIDVAFQPEKGFLHAKATVTLRAAERIEAVELELNSRLRIQELTDERGDKLEFTRSGRMGSPRFSVRLAKPCEPENTIALTSTYEGTLPAGPLDYITKDGILLRDESRWYPAVDLSAFTENDVTIHVPKGWYALTSGERVEGNKQERANAFQWRTVRAVSSRAIVAAPEYSWPCTDASASDAKGVSSLVVCVRGGQPSEQQHLAGEVLSLLARYTGLLETSPQKNLAVVQGFPRARGAVGYSAPGVLVISEDVVKHHDYPGYAPEFLPHEIAHQWFPISVTLASESDGWLAESLAEYLAWRYLLEREPEQARLMVARAMRDALAPEPLRPINVGLHLFALESPG